MGALQHKLRDAPKPSASVTPITPPLTVEAARAGRQAAEAALRDARAAVQVVVDGFHGAYGRRDLVVQMRPQAAMPGRSRPIDYTRSDEANARLDQYEAFDRVVAEEEAAQRALSRAEGVEAAAIKAEFGDGRATLAAAIKASAERRAEADAARATAERARGALVKAQMAHSSAEAALSEAREAAIGAATAADGVQPVGLKDLRRATADALDDVDIASEAVARAEAALVDPERAERSARAKVEDTARAVLAEAASGMVSGLDDLVLAFKGPMLCRLNFMLSALPSFFPAAFMPEQQQRARVESLLSAVAAIGRQVHPRDLGVPLGADLYDSALDALKLDAMAPLPEMP